MSLSEKGMLDVMALADGELEGDELAAAERLVEESPEAAELLASLRALGDGVRSSFDVGTIDVRDVVMAALRPNELDRARAQRAARIRIAAVGVSIVAIAAVVLFYVREASNGTVATSPSASSSSEAMLAAANTGVEVDFVDTPTPVSVFIVPAKGVGGEEMVTEAPSVIVWVPEDNTPPPAPAGTNP